MAFLSEAERDELRIERMVFHVVGPELDAPVLLAEFDPPIFTDFFVKRIKSALGGNAYRFRDDSPTMTQLRSVAADTSRFLSVSEELARSFQDKHRTTTSDGVFFLFLLGTADGKQLFALVKYDNDQVLKYDIADRDGQREAILEEFRQTFSTKRESLQKIALVRLGDEDGVLMVRDRSRPDAISEYFEKFLRVKRESTPADSTRRVQQMYKDVFLAHKPDLDPEIVKEGARRINDRLRNAQEFGPETHGQLFDAIFGVLPEDSPVRKTYARRLASLKLDEETFAIAPDAIPRSRRRRMETAEGFQILYDDEVKNLIHKEPLEAGGFEIRIKTREVTVDDDDISASNGRA